MDETLDWGGAADASSAANVNAAKQMNTATRVKVFWVRLFSVRNFIGLYVKFWFVAFGFTTRKLPKGLG